MKTPQLLLLTMILFLTNSCSVDDDPMVEHKIYGAWNLVEVSGTIAGITHEFEYGTIIWDFASSNIVVENNNLDNDLIDKFETGTYSYLINTLPELESDCLQTIAFSTDDINCLQYDYDTMFITQNVADGITLKFIR